MLVQENAGPRPFRRWLLALSCLACLASTAVAQPGEAPHSLAYDAQSRGPVPIPPTERGLQTVVAELWFKVSDEAFPLEGAAFDRRGDLLFVDAAGGRAFRLTPDKHLSIVLPGSKQQLGGLAVHKDGRIFAARTGEGFRNGSVVAMQPDGSGLRTVVPADAGYVVNDLVFDA